MDCDRWRKALPRTSPKTRVRIRPGAKATPFRVEIDRRATTIALEPLAGLLKLLRGERVTLNVTDAGLNITYKRMAMTLFDLSATKNHQDAPESAQKPYTATL